MNYNLILKFMNLYIIFFIIVLIIIFIGVFLIFKYTKKYKISSDKVAFFNKQLKKIFLSGSYKEQIIDIDKLYHKILQEAGYKGTFGEILKTKPSEIGDLQRIWELHKLRNKLVHDFDLLSEGILKKKSNDYRNQIEKLIKQFK